ncbi:hypothetical protein ScPMuIL_007596 [Solemya velum]
MSVMQMNDMDILSQKSGDAISRIDILSRPKRIPVYILEDRRSVYWVDFVPPRPTPNGVTEIVASERVLELARHKTVPDLFHGDRPSPIWPVRRSTLNATPSSRIDGLSLYKKVHARHRMERSPFTQVNPNAKRTTASPRLKQLATPKVRSDKFDIRETEWGQYFPVLDTAKRATATPRVETLSETKAYHPNFKDERPVQWPLTDAALKAIASLRLQQMARPRSRTMIKDDYDPYRVSLGARRARPTPRIEEISLPIARKIRQKKS